MNQRVCQACGGRYEDGNEEGQAGWIGCDEDSGRWFSYTSAGFSHKPKQLPSSFVRTANKCLSQHYKSQEALTSFISKLLKNKCGVAH